MGRHKAESDGETTPVAASLHKVVKRYDQTTVLHGVTLDIPRGKTTLISGPSGSGKSTSIRMMANLETPSSGRVRLFGRMLGTIGERQQQRLIAENVSYGQQHPALDGSLTVFENMYLTALALKGRRARPELQARAGAIASHFGIAHLLNRPADRSLSGGERAKVALGRSLVKGAELLILDEPTAAVDPRGTAVIYERLRDIQRAEGLTVVMVSHDDDTARANADHEIVIDSGNVARTIDY